MVQLFVRTPVSTALVSAPWHFGGNLSYTLIEFVALMVKMNVLRGDEGVETSIFDHGTPKNCKVQRALHSIALLLAYYLPLFLVLRLFLASSV